MISLGGKLHFVNCVDSCKGGGKGILNLSILTLLHEALSRNSPALISFCVVVLVTCDGKLDLNHFFYEINVHCAVEKILPYP
jgi:hypothetical protein